MKQEYQPGYKLTESYRHYVNVRKQQKNNSQNHGAYDGNSLPEEKHRITDEEAVRLYNIVKFSDR